MRTNRLNHIIHFLGFLNSKRDSLYQEFKNNEELKEIMQKAKVDTVFQPILSLKDGSTVGFEVLNRPYPSQQFPSTDLFYDYVGKSGYVFMVEQFLRNLSLSRFAEKVRISSEFKDQLVFLNIQPQVLADPTYRTGITKELLAKHDLSPNQIVLELTEKEAVENYEQFKKVIEHYRYQGFRIAVDDVGTGYNSLKTLISLKPEFIKLDKSLIRDISKQKEQQHLVELLLEYALLADTTIIAEGIETVAELRFIQKLGVHMGQGYALGKPKSNLCSGQVPLSIPPLQEHFIH